MLTQIHKYTNTNYNVLALRPFRKGIGAKFEGNTNDFQYPDIIEGDSNGLVIQFKCLNI